MTASEQGHRDLLASIGKALRLRRVELDMKRSELAERAGLSYAYVAEIENGTKQASSKALWMLAKALGLEPHELMASAARVETPERAPVGAAPMRRMMESAGDRLPVAGAARVAGVGGAARTGEAAGTGETARAGGAARTGEAAGTGETARAGGAAGTGEARSAGWFHLSPSSTQGSPAAASPAAAIAPGEVGDAGGPAGRVDLPGLPDILARLEMALEGIPTERAELALMLALDERRTRRIVREELGRQRPSS